MSEPIVLIDGDPIVYRCGFAGQHRIIHAILEAAEGSPFPVRFEGKTDRNNYLKEHPEHELLVEEEELEVEPLPFVLQTVKQSLSPIELLGNPQLFLTGSGNFREKLNPLYKASRRETPRPVHYQAIREYLQTHKLATLVDGREADDEISIRAHRLREAGLPYIVATIDKDLDQIPGRHYDYMRHIEYEVSEEQAEKWFWQQCLSGDPTDGVPGCWKIGRANAAAMVDDWYLQKWTPEAIWEAIVETYRLSQKKSGCKYTDDDPARLALETARLVWMQKEPGELWNPPGIPFGRIEGDVDD